MKETYLSNIMHPLSYHQKRVSYPKAPPVWGAGRNGLVLAVQGHCLRGGLAHGTPADVGLDLLLGQRRRGQRRGAGQPVGLVIAAGVVTHLVDVAVGKWHGAKHRQAGSCQTWKQQQVMPIISLPR